MHYKLVWLCWWGSLSYNRGTTQGAFVTPCALLHLPLPACLQGPDDEPVWRQALLRSLNRSDPEVAQQVAAAWATW